MNLELIMGNDLLTFDTPLVELVEANEYLKRCVSNI